MVFITASASASATSLPGSASGLDPLWVTAWATATLAAVGMITLVGLIVTIRQNRSLASSASEQAKAATRQAELQLIAYLPQLRPGWVSVPSQGARNVEVIYAAGTLPAQNVQVWLRLADELYQGTHALLSAADRETVTARALSGGPAMTSPFEDMPKTPLARDTDERWIGLIWLDPQGKEHRSSWEYSNGQYRLISMKLERSAP